MKRYQVYLNPYPVTIFDEVEELTDISRSKIIRDSLDRVAQNIAQVLAAVKPRPSKTFVLEKMAGFIKSTSRFEKLELVEIYEKGQGRVFNWGY